MTNSGVPAIRTPALDFCYLVAAKQRAGFFAVALESGEEQMLDRILMDAEDGATQALEERARAFLVLYQEREQCGIQVLKAKERRRLARILRSQRRIRVRLSPTQATAAAIVCLLIALSGAGILTVRYINSHQSGPPAGISNQHIPAQQVPPANSDLQNLREDWKPWNQLTVSDQRPQTGSPGLLLLENGTYNVSGWTVAADSPAWQPDIIGSVGTVKVRGTYADITDSDGNPYIVGIDQPFIVSGNPGTVLKVDPTGNVYYMTLAKATAIRHQTGK